MHRLDPEFYRLLAWIFCWAAVILIVYSVVMIIYGLHEFFTARSVCPLLYSGAILATYLSIFCASTSIKLFDDHR